jgi:2-dehydro-3-deoxygluconokinase
VDGKMYYSPTCELDILDWIGSGDGFASGFFFGLMKDEGIMESVNPGWAHDALVPFTRGSNHAFTGEHAFANGCSSRVQR